MALLSPRKITSPRRGFSLIELMVVIVIIAILMGMLFVGINSAMSAARVTAVNAEIQNLEKGIADFKLQYGVEPPSFIVLYEKGDSGSDDPSWGADTTTGLGNMDTLRRASRAALRSIWPNYNFAANIDINGDGDSDDVFVLDGAECLAFFLGGVTRQVDTDGNGSVTYTDGFQAFGFSANGTAPFSGTSGSRIGPFVEMLGNRLVDRQRIAAGSYTASPKELPEYYDGMPSTTPGVTGPFQYFSSYDGAGYRPYGLNNTDDSGTVTDDEGVEGGLSVPYIQSVTGSGTGSGGTATFWKANSFQIIAPGADGEFGTGGGYINNKFVNASDLSDRSSAASSERDNIANFKGGRLQ